LANLVYPANTLISSGILLPKWAAASCFFGKPPRYTRQMAGTNPYRAGVSLATIL
jgi:hypothetical protein